MTTIRIAIALMSSLLVLSGCASTEEQEKQRMIELTAQSRASVLSAGLPIEQGPLSIMRASAKNGVVELMMLYNTDAKGAKPIDSVIKSSMDYYCNNVEVLQNLEIGVSYRILLRNSRGQLMVDELISQQRCESL
ncbi:GspS/AspS pilotin family protein [Vibrio cortegadensis]|uniref:GspS/AspS pilotin family protein n=1 Tax=Vibrio cortegadensis TaxID=1328770 RepID=UPI00352C9AED